MLRDSVNKHLEEMSQIPVEEYTLYRKWCEINEKEWSAADRQRIFEIENSMWVPKEPEDYLKLEPVLYHTSDPFINKTWLILRIFTSTMPWNINVGRIQRFVVADKVTRQYLGVISVASDFISLGGRDKHIGWNYNQRIKNKMLNHTACGTSIVPTQPLGFSFVGGKLMALLTACDVIENIWNEKYKELLVGITTTSLYGGYSQYNRLSYWKKCASTEGRIPLEPIDSVYKELRQWVKDNYPSDFDRITKNTTKILSRPKNRMLNFAYAKLKIRPPENHFSRGVYWCSLYENSEDFLAKRTAKLGERKFDNSVRSLTNLWKERYASKRVKSLVKSGRYKTDKLFYNGMIGLSWDETKDKYLKEVGR